jgi:Cadherin domain
LVLKKPLDFERRSSYSLALTASDNALDKRTRLSASATVAVQVQDVQDQPPMFLNAPFSATVPEQIEAGVSVLSVRAKDGDAGEPRKIQLTLEGDYDQHFQLITELDPQGVETLATLITTDVPLDREDPRILQNGGIYTFNVVVSSSPKALKFL